MTSVLDKTLDDVISSRPRNKRRTSRRSSAKATLVGSPTTVAAKAPRARKAAQTQAQTKSVAPNAQKIIVSNLPFDVNEAQIQELFTASIGPTKEVTLNYDPNGRSKGVASVVFTRSGDGTRAHKEYHNRLIDGKRAMKVEIVLDPSKPQPPSLSQRVGPAPATGVKAGAAAGATRGKKGARGRGGRKKGTERPNKSAADLDAEMADYTGATTTTAT